jgi:predicted SPOUT superfamily RNA methylase MTH1
VSSWSGGGKVYIGSRQYFTVRSVKRLALGERVLVRIVSIKPPRAKLVVPEDVEIYIGYKVIEIEDINDLVEYLNTKPQIKVVMSKEGNNYGDQKLRRALLKEILRSEGIILMFGNPKKDPDEILPKEAIEAINPRFRINIIPYQGVLSVRTLEAIHTTLSILNIDLFQYEIQKTNKA